MITTNTTSPLVVSLGLGVDSVAMLVGYWQRGIRPDLILFAHVGNEKDETYAYLPKIQAWLKAVGFPPVTVVQRKVTRFKHGHYASLGMNAMRNATLPSLAFGRHGCSAAWKIEPMDKFVKSWAPAKEAFARGLKVRRAIGYDCSPKESKRFAHVEGRDEKLWEFVYPLRDWQWDREECKRQILAAGLDLPVKSACWFCPASKPAELHELPEWQLKHIVIMETRAKPELKKVQGLWRKGTKARPGAMTDYIYDAGLLPQDEVVRLVDQTPLGKGNPELDKFLVIELGGKPA